MSLLTFLCFTSLLYISQADPVPTAAVTSQNPVDMQAQVDDLVAAINTALTTFLTPLLKELDQDDQDYLTDIAIQGINDYLNYVLYLLKDEIDLQSAVPVLDKSVIIQLQSSDGYLVAGNSGTAAAGGSK